MVRIEYTEEFKLEAIKLVKETDQNNCKNRKRSRCMVQECGGIIKHEKEIPSKEGLWLHGCAGTTAYSNTK